MRSNRPEPLVHPKRTESSLNPKRTVSTELPGLSKRPLKLERPDNPERPVPLEKRFSRGIKLVVAMVVVLFVVLVIPVYGLRSQAPDPVSGGSVDANPNAEPSTIRISLVGDVNLADGWSIDVAAYHGDSVAAAFSPEILEHLQSADISYANHEFTMSSRGEALEKYYIIRADPSRVGYWKQMGVDIVGLGNNHAFDYGEEAFLDTLEILQQNGIEYVGAGVNLAEAMAPASFTFDGYTVAFVAADRSQKGDEVRAQQASEDSPGVLFCFEDELFLAAVAAAREEADFVIALPHWGTEMSTELETVQVELAQKLIDAGADAVVGSHPHILQGIEFYNGKLIAYSLGNFWFNDDYTPTMILDIEIVEGQARFRIVPALQTGQQVLTSDEITAEVFGLMRELSPDIEIDNKGYISSLL